MLIIKSSGELSRLISSHISNSKTIGLVPTMGALHEGHLSLLRQCKNEMDITVVSIFINPTQFNNKEDFEKYPITLEKDIYILEKNGCDVLFLPEVKDMYPDESYKIVHFDLGNLENVLEGKYRPGHFQGVCQAVKRLLEIITPHTLYAGQKDYQQCLIIKTLITIIKSKTIVTICETVREPDGLAMSSRNLRLTSSERKNAAALYHALHVIKSGFRHDNITDLKYQASSILHSSDFEIDYVELADAKTLVPVERLKKTDNIVALIAASINKIRLIDNLIINENN